MEDDQTRSDPVASRAAAQRPQDEWIGRVIDGRYSILERLGEGGMGAVFVAEHTQLRKRVALKVIHAHFAGNDEIAARFAREAMTSAHIEHPNVASALDFGSLPEGGAYLVMQLVRGPSLSEYLTQHGALSYVETCQITAQIADAVTAAHAAGIVHRDLKPDNVILMPNDEGPPTVKVLDFGIAHVKAHNQAPRESGRQLTQFGVIIGTPGYMPPEQATGQGVDERADLYALGVIIWELLTGHGPFDADNFSEIVTRQLSAPAPELVLRTDVMIPEELRQLVRRLLERAVNDRPRSASEVRDTLRTLASRTSAPPISARPSAAYGEAPTVAAMPSVPSAAPPNTRRWSWPVVVVTLLLAFGVLRWAFGSNTQAAVPPTPPAAVVAPAPAAPTAPVERVAEPERQRDDEAAADPAAEDATESDSASSGKRTSSKRTRSRPRPVQRLRRALDDLLQ